MTNGPARDGYRTVTPRIVVDDVVAQCRYFEKVFGAPIWLIAVRAFLLTLDGRGFDRGRLGTDDP